MKKNVEITNQITPLLQGLKNGVGKNKFVGIMIQLIGICKINQFEKEEMFQLFQNVLFEAEFDENQSHDYLAVYINQVNNHKKDDFDLEQFEQAMFALIQSPEITKKVEVLENVKTSLQKQRDEDVEIEYKVLKEAEEIDYEAIALADEAEYEQYEEEEAGDTGILDGSFWESQRPVTIAENLQAGFENNQRQRTVEKVPHLIRENSGEEIPLEKDVFSMGKEAGTVDYVIYGNTTVSRKHAEIIKRGRHYFICDKGSTNKTYVEGKEIRPEEFVEIHNGTRIKISNEAFTFYQ